MRRRGEATEFALDKPGEGDCGERPTATLANGGKHREDLPFDIGPANCGVGW